MLSSISLSLLKQMILLRWAQLFLSRRLVTASGRTAESRQNSSSSYNTGIFPKQFASGAAKHDYSSADPLLIRRKNFHVPLYVQKQQSQNEVLEKEVIITCFSRFPRETTRWHTIMHTTDTGLFPLHGNHSTMLYKPKGDKIFTSLVSKVQCPIWVIVLRRASASLMPSIASCCCK